MFGHIFNLTLKFGEDNSASISTKFGFIWLSGYRAEDRNATVVQIMTTDEGHKVMSISHMTLWARWAGLKKKMINTVHITPGICTGNNNLV